MRRRRLLATVGATVGLAGCLSEFTGGSTPTPASGPFTLRSPAFDEGQSVPEEFTCDGENHSPKLTVSGTPTDARTLALVVDDPDAPSAEPYVHWLLWGVPADLTEIPGGIPRGKTVPELQGAEQGTNGAGKVGYSGPCPPTGDGPHTYRFTLYALDGDLSLSGGAKRPAFEEARRGHVVARARLTGTHER